MHYVLLKGITNVNGPHGIRGPDGDRGYRGDRGQPGYLVRIFDSYSQKNELFVFLFRVLMVYKDRKEKKVILVHPDHR